MSDKILTRDIDDMSARGLEWVTFSALVVDHIEKYTVPQYGDIPTDQLSEWSVQQCIDSIQRYCRRANTNARGEEEALRDLLKIAHYAGVAYMKRRGINVIKST
ncbi:MAG: hypothetical protein BWY21_00563 [Parcubacteria group bacterium ADurb.Bin216]|nr:MAG: hypothetical protein BWY21_00563 [Parcubacteria group bacterium ADurb.Bin216]